MPVTNQQFSRGGRWSRTASQSPGIFTHGADFMNDLLIVDLMES